MSEDFRHGQPLRAETLNRRMRSAEARAAENMSALEQAGRRLEQLELALLSVERPPPKDLPQQAGRPGRIFMKAQPLENAELFGPSVVTQNVRSKSALVSPVEAVGEKELVRPGAVFAGLSEKREAAFTARVSPSYLTDYNEIILPHVGEGPLTWRLYHSSGYYEYTDVTRTTVRRFSEPREFNGHVQLTSRSATGFEGQYVHCAGGLLAKQSDWTQSGTLEARREITWDGQMRIEGINLWPSQEDFTEGWRLFVDGEQVSALQQISVQKGSSLRVELDISWNHTVSFVSLDIFRTQL